MSIVGMEGLIEEYDVVPRWGLLKFGAFDLG